MNNKKVLKIGNIFTFAEDRLIEKVKRGDIYTYSVGDVIDQAIRVRAYLDKNPNPKIPTQTKEERKFNEAKRVLMTYYLRKKHNE
jgi:hypothetical protein